jgi:hypothetical protein
VTRYLVKFRHQGMEGLPVYQSDGYTVVFSGLFSEFFGSRYTAVTTAQDQNILCHAQMSP